MKQPPSLPTARQLSSPHPSLPKMLPRRTRPTVRSRAIRQTCTTESLHGLSASASWCDIGAPIVCGGCTESRACATPCNSLQTLRSQPLRRQQHRIPAVVAVEFPRGHVTRGRAAQGRRPWREPRGKLDNAAQISVSCCAAANFAPHWMRSSVVGHLRARRTFHTTTHLSHLNTNTSTSTGTHCDWPEPQAGRI